MANRVTDRLLMHRIDTEGLSECEKCGYLFADEQMVIVDRGKYCMQCAPYCECCTTRVVGGGLCKVCQEGEDRRLMDRDWERGIYAQCDAEDAGEAA